MADLSSCRTLGDVLRQRAAERPEATALVFDERRTSFGGLARQARQVANGLLALGAGPGSRVAYLGKNTDHFCALLFGAAMAGAVLVPVNWRLALPEMAAILRDAETRVLFVGPGFAASAAALDLPDLALFSLDGAAPGWADFAAWRDAQADGEPGVAVAPDDTCLQLYTSGTTGLPKGVELMHRNCLAMLIALQEGGCGSVGPEDVLLICMPLFHAAGVLPTLVGLAHGSAVVLLAEMDVPAIVAAFARHGVTWLILVPAALLMVVRHPAAASADFSSLRRLTYGASPIAESLVLQAKALFPNAGFYHLYGLTEACGAGTISPPEAHDPARGKLQSCGLPYPTLELRIVDPTGAAVPPRTVGEIVLRGPTVMKGYWRNPEATRAAFTPDGWLRTGDAAYRDEDGFFYVHDRVKDMIVSGGENVYPAEVENALYGHPAIADVAVIGVPDERWGEAVKAVVVLKPGAAASAEDIVAYARERIAGYKLPKSIDFVDALPRNPTGKLLKRVLRAPYWEGRARQVG